MKEANGRGQSVKGKTGGDSFPRQSIDQEPVVEMDQPSVSSHSTNGLSHHVMTSLADGTFGRVSSVTVMKCQPVCMLS
ncbi:MAG: hypothetical protein CL569_10355 [Alphaproteobacteria bacterium]|nr:hypothetical protein [Alphaproteobacteria bacterium]